MKKFKIHRKCTWYIGLFLFLGILASCSDDIESDGKEITDFSVISSSGQIFKGTIGEGNVISIKITPDFNIDNLKNSTSNFFLSYYATVSPLPSESQDFSQDVVYTVTAQDGSAIVYTVRWNYGDILADGQGGGYTMRKWYKTFADLGLTNDIENSLAVCGDYLVVSRTGLLFNKTTGEPAGKLLNMEGIAGGTVAQQVPFFLTNDSEGNMIGCTLAAWSGDFKVYKWTSVDAAPIEILSTSEVGTSVGRKLTVVGDVNGDGYILTTFVGSANGTHFRWKITGGVVSISHDLVETGIPINDGNWSQNIAPLNASANSPYFVGDAVAGGTSIHYFNGSSTAEIMGLVTDADAGPKNWGNFTQTHVVACPFNGKAYGAVISSSWGRCFFTIKDSEANNEVFFSDIWNNNTYNGNATGSLTSSLSADGQSLYIYALVTSRGIACYQLTKYEK